MQGAQVKQERKSKNKVCREVVQALGWNKPAKRMSDWVIMRARALGPLGASGLAPGQVPMQPERFESNQPNLPTLSTQPNVSGGVMIWRNWHDWMVLGGSSCFL